MSRIVTDTCSRCGAQESRAVGNFAIEPLASQWVRLGGLNVAELKELCDACAEELREDLARFLDGWQRCENGSIVEGSGVDRRPFKTPRAQQKDGAA